MKTSPCFKQTFPLQQISQAAHSLWEAIKPQAAVVLLQGEMGSGKTTLIRTLCSEILDVKEQVSSPTFGIVNEYHSPLLKQEIYHIDLYRLPDIEAFWEIGGAEYLQAARYCFIEWGKPLEAHLNQPHYLVEMSHLPNGENDREMVVYRLGTH